MGHTLRLALLHCAAAAALCGGAASAQTPRVPPSGGAWSAGAGFGFASSADRMRRSVSGMACAPDQDRQPVCLVVFDEGTQARFARLGTGTLTPLAGEIAFDIPGKELDAEAAATDGAFFYVAGSHAVKRSGCKRNDSSRHVLRFRRDARTGLAEAGAGGEPLAGYQGSQRLAALLRADPALQQRLGLSLCLGEGGLDIEALAIRNGRLHFGLRGPTEGAYAFIVSVDAEGFFSGADPHLGLTRVHVGTRRGLRDMAVVSQGILLLAGPDDQPGSAGVDWQVALWDDASAATGVAEPRPLALLDLRSVALGPCDKQTKPEALAVLEESAAFYRVLVLSDGMCDGGARVFEIPR